MRKLLLALAVAAFAGGAQAQIKCWNENGRRVCGDAPPPGAKVTTLNTPSAPAPAAKDAKAPMTPAEREADYRKRQAEAAKAAEKASKEQQAADSKKQACDAAKDNLRMYESGQRISRTNAQGERYFLDDAQIEAERAKARQTIQSACSG